MVDRSSGSRSARAGTGCYVSDLRALFEDLSMRGATLSKGLEEMSWKELELDDVDRDVNKICFTQRAPQPSST